MALSHRKAHTTCLQEEVKVRRRFQRSMRLDTDLKDPLALQGFVCPATFAHALTVMFRQIQETGHGAFTWTGPFGCGKTSLAVVLAALLGRPDNRQRTALTLMGQTGKRIRSMLELGTRGYHALSIVGRKQDGAELITEALRRDRLVRHPVDHLARGGTVLLDTLHRVATRPNRAGLIIFIDELGKILEAAAQGQGDLHFLQELAERSCRSNGRLIVIGILHQSFAEYAGRLAHRTREEWQKVQGRFVDIPLATMAHEQLALLSAAIESNPPSAAMSAAEDLVAISDRHHVSQDDDLVQHLAGCWPLNPITASLVGPFSRRRFGQNQRSLFSFLNSAEPKGFQTFLGTATRVDMYNPAMFWDYLQDNLAPTILASPDGHRWAMAVDALERCEIKFGEQNHLEVAKTIAVIGLFREQAGFFASRDVLQVAIPHIPTHHLTKILDNLTSSSIVVHRRHQDAYAIYAGSDFDIEKAIQEERSQRLELDPSLLQHLSNLQPIVAKRHYHQTGALRWFEVQVIPIYEAETRIAVYRPSPGSLGLFLLVLPIGNMTEAEACITLRKVSRQQEKGAWVTAGLVPHGAVLVDWAEELLALGRILSDRAELNGDAVARQEVNARHDAARIQLGSALQKAFLSMTWYCQDQEYKLNGMAAIQRYASQLADAVFPQTPRIPNELLNRIKPSSSAAAARRALMYAMVNERGKPRLGIKGYPAEGGLYQSLLAATGLYRVDTNSTSTPSFLPPSGSDPGRLAPLWEAADTILDSTDREPLEMTVLYEVWKHPPYGVKDGLLPVLVLAYLLSRGSSIAVYLDSMFRPIVDDFLVDRLQQEPASVQMRKVDFDPLRQRVLAGIRDLASEYGNGCTARDDALDIARQVVAIVMGLPTWTQLTNTLSDDAQRLRRIVKTASDPNRLLFDDLPSLASMDVETMTDLDIATYVESIRKGLTELVQAYSNMLAQLRSLLLRELGFQPGSPQLAERAQSVIGLTGDFRLDAFATRLSRYEGTNEDTEGIASLAINKPPRDWVDRDLDHAQVEIAALAQQFKRSEAFARVKGRTEHRHAIALVVGISGSSNTMAKEFDIDAGEAEEADRLVQQIASILELSPTNSNVALAALVQVGAQLISQGAVSTPPMTSINGTEARQP